MAAVKARGPAPKVAALVLALTLTLPMLPAGISGVGTVRTPLRDGEEALAYSPARDGPSSSAMHSANRPDLWPLLGAPPSLPPKDVADILEGAAIVPDGRWSGPLVADRPWVVDGDLLLDGATMRLTGGAALAVRGDLTIRASSIVGENARWATGERAFAAPIEDAPASPATPVAREGDGEEAGPKGSFLFATGAVHIEGSSFRGVTLLLDAGPAPARVLNSEFRDGSDGIVSSRAPLEVAGATFYNLRAGVVLRSGDSAGTDAIVHDRFPEIHNSTFQNDLYGIIVGDGTGHFHHNEARGNFMGVACLSAGRVDTSGDIHKPFFERNNLYTNLGEALSGARGLTVGTPLGQMAFANSRCEFDATYSGPDGAAGDSAFLGPEDTFTNRLEEPAANSAPTLPLPLTEVTEPTTWTGQVAVPGPIVVNAGGELTLDGATTSGVGMFGAKAGGALTLSKAKVGVDNIVVFRNDGDEAGSTIFGHGAMAFAPSPSAGGGGKGGLGQPIIAYRCNCTLEDNEFHGHTGLYLASAPYVDDFQWSMTVRDSSFRNAIGIAAANHVLATLEGLEVAAQERGIQSALATIVLADSTLHADVGFWGSLTKLTSSGNVYEGGGRGVASTLSTLSFTQDLFANLRIGIQSESDASVAVALSNFTLNAVGILPTGTSVVVTNSNLVDNAPWAMVTLPSPTLPSGVTCTNCHGPPDEAWHGNVNYTAALVPNDVPQPAWAASQHLALPGTTVDLEGGLDAPAIARSGGTLRVANASLALTQRFPLLVKGGGNDGGVTGRLDLDNATVTWARRDGGFEALRYGNWRSLLVNSTDSSVRHTTFSGFEEHPLTLHWNGGGDFECVRHRPANPFDYLARWHVGPTGSPLEVRRLLVEEGAGVSLDWAGFPVAFPQTTQGVNATVLDSGITATTLHGALVHRWVNASVEVRDSNLLGPKGAMGISDVGQAPHIEAFDARDNYWGDDAGPGGDGSIVGGQALDSATSETVPPLTTPHRETPASPSPCVAWDVVTATLLEGETAEFRDRSFDPSALGATATWDWADGTEPTTDPGSTATHTFSTWGTYAVSLTLASASGTTATHTRDVRVLARPVAQFEAEGQPKETEAVAFEDLSTDADGDVVAWSWAFGDGGTSAAQHPSHRYADGGAYTVRLTVTDDDGLPHAQERTVVVDHAPPVASFSLEADDLLVAFQDQSTHPNPADAPPAGWTWTWDFGDGAVSGAQHPSHTFASEVVYEVTLRVTDNDGQSAALTRQVDLRNQPPASDFATTPSVPVAGGTTTFEDLSSDPDGDVVAWAWDFGDGATSYEAEPEHVYASGGDYQVTLTVTDDDGATATVAHELHVCETGFQYSAKGIHVELCEEVSAQELLNLLLGDG